MKKQKIITYLLGLMCMSSFSQTITPVVVASEGDFYTSPSGSVSWTLGELSTESYSIAANYLTQGFQQPKLMLATGIKSPVADYSGINAYPNPVSGNLVLSFEKSSLAYRVEIFDSSGKKVHSENINSSVFSAANISFSEFENGIYLVTVFDESGRTMKGSFRINKLN